MLKVETLGKQLEVVMTYFYQGVTVVVINTQTNSCINL